jgi:glycosyltransferase involved in cell wall biosynthesis
MVAEASFARGGQLRDDSGELLFVGRLIQRKGAEFAIRAVAELVRAGRSTRLTIVGDGPERAALAALAESLGVDARVGFTGALTPALVRSHYERARVLLMPAITDWKGEQEGFGMVIVEAMAYGVPVVASRSGGIPDIIRDGENGLLVPEADGAALAAAVGRLLDDPALAHRLGEAGRTEARDRFSPRGIAARFDAVYRRAAGSQA